MEFKHSITVILITEMFSVTACEFCPFNPLMHDFFKQKKYLKCIYHISSGINSINK